MSTPPKSRLKGGVHAKVAQILVSSILSGRHPPGSTLPNEELLSAELGVSRGALREALRRLAAIGLIEARPRTGTRIRPREDWNHLDPLMTEPRLAPGEIGPFVRNCIELRMAIEPAAAALATEQADYSKVARIVEAFGRMERTIASGPEHLAADVEFHRAIFLAADNELFWTTGRLMESALRVAFMGQTSAAKLRRTADLHRGVLDAILERDRDGARRNMRTLIHSSCRDLSDHLGVPLLPRTGDD